MARPSGFKYRKAITVNHTDDGAQDLYQMKLLVGETSGAVGADVDLNGHVLTNFYDVRFVGLDADGTTEVNLDYWIESITGTTPNQLATIWVEVHYIPAHPNNTTIWMYYGNAGASDASNGANTFKLFGGWEWGNAGDSIAVSGGSVTWTISIGVATISTTHAYGVGTKSAKMPHQTLGIFATGAYVRPGDSNMAVMMRCYKQVDATGVYFCCIGTDTKSVVLATAPDVSKSEEIKYDDTAWRSTGVNVPTDEWFEIEWRNANYTAGTYDIYLNGDLVKSAAGMKSAAGDIDGKVFIGNSSPLADTNGDVWLDNIIIRNWTANEPTWGAWGAEEVQNNISSQSQAVVLRMLGL